MTYEEGERRREAYLTDWQDRRKPQLDAMITRSLFEFTQAALVADLNARAQQLRRYTRLPLIVAWVATIAAIVISHFTPGEYLIMAVLPLLGAGTFSYFAGWPIKRR